MVYRPKHQIALGQVRWALSNGIRFSWLTFDEGYGGKPPFLRALDALGQNYVAELPGNFRAWTRRPAVRYRPHGRKRRMGRPPRYPRLKAKSNPTAEVRQYRTIRRHLALSAVSHLFPAQFRLVATGDSTRRAERGKKSGSDGRPGPRGHGNPRADLDPRRMLLEETPRPSAAAFF